MFCTQLDIRIVALISMVLSNALCIELCKIYKCGVILSVLKYCTLQAVKQQ